MNCNFDIECSALQNGFEKADLQKRCEGGDGTNEVGVCSLYLEQTEGAKWKDEAKRLSRRDLHSTSKAKMRMLYCSKAPASWLLRSYSSYITCFVPLLGFAIQTFV